MCVPVREKQKPMGHSTEGKVCRAAHNAAMSTYRSPRDWQGISRRQQVTVFLTVRRKMRIPGSKKVPQEKCVMAQRVMRSRISGG